MLQASGLLFHVTDTQKQGAHFLHTGSLENGSLSVGDEITCKVDNSLRKPTVLNHSATHLMHAALRETLGDHVEQKGSLVNPNYLRFDFSHNKPVTDAELKQIEKMVNAQILENAEVSKEVMTMDAAKGRGAMALLARNMVTRCAL